METFIHPEIIQGFAVKALKARGWEIAKPASVVHGIIGCNFGKITRLPSKPEVMLELELDFNPNVSIKPGAEPMILTTTLEDLNTGLASIDYITLDGPAIQQIAQFRAKAKAK